MPFLHFKVSVEKFAVILMGLPFSVICFFSLVALNILSLFSMLVVLMIICCGAFFFGQICLVSQRIPEPEWETLP
jgi:hypothetical protein